MPSTRFETEGISSGRRLYLQVWYGIACLRAEITVKDFYKISNIKYLNFGYKDINKNTEVKSYDINIFYT